jgi:hypothetical protein
MEEHSDMFSAYDMDAVHIQNINDWRYQNTMHIHTAAYDSQPTMACALAAGTA